MPTILDNATLLPIGACVAIVMAVISALVWYGRDRLKTLRETHATQVEEMQAQHRDELKRLHRDAEMNSALADIRNELKDINRRIDHAVADPWHRRQMKLWADLLRLRNEQVDVPAVDEVD